MFKISEYLSLKETSLKDTYYANGDGIDIGTLKATYHNVIDDEDITEKIEECTLYIDNKEVEVEDGVIQKALKPGEYEFKLKWKYEGDKFEEKKTVEITDFDPWGYFDENNNLIGAEYYDIVNRYGPRIKTGGMEGGEVYQMAGNNLWYLFSYNYMIDLEEGISETDDIYKGCLGIAGTAEQMFGATENISMKQLEDALEPDYGFEFTPESYFDIDNWYTEKTVNGKTYTIQIYHMGADQRVDGETYIFIKKSFY